MKRTRELTAIHYRRSLKRPAAPDQPNCPVCGSPLQESPVNDLAGLQRGHVKAGPRVAPLVERPEPSGHRGLGSGN